MHTLNFEIDYQNECAGWITCHLTIDGRRHSLQSSWVFPPFIPLLRFLKAIAGQRLPANFFWDEEGRGAEFEAESVGDDSKLVHLKITYMGHETIPWLDACLEPEAILSAFLPPILAFAENFPSAETDWGTPRRLVDMLHQSIVRGIPARSDAHAPQPVTCRVEADYETPYLEGDIFFKIEFEEEEIVSIILFDTNPYWQQLVDFLGAIASNDLPSTCEHTRVIDFSNIAPGEQHFQIVTRMVAEPLEVKENFRLKIFVSDYARTDFLRLEEVVHRRQFTSGFSDSFLALLEEKYRMEPDLDGQTFDLRTLPLDNLLGQ